MSERPPTSSGDRTRTPPPNDSRRAGGLTSSPRPRAKDSNNTTLCRNLTIYGYCRYEGKGCAFNHDPTSISKPPNGVSRSLVLSAYEQKGISPADGPVKSSSLGRGKFNVDSPSFTPSTPPKNVISPKLADAPPFTPRALAASAILGNLTPPVQPQFQDATNSFMMGQQGIESQAYQLQQGFDSLLLGDNSVAQNITPYDYSNVQQVNPYAGHDMYYQSQQSGYPMPLNFLNYAPVAPYPQKLLPFQKNVHSFFLSDNVREELQRKGEAARQTMPTGILPPTINEYRSLVPLDLSNKKNPLTFGYPSWVYKAFSTEDSNIYALRRVEGFRLTNENDIRIIQRWKKVTSANIVTIHNAWTTTKFGDSSIIFVYDYHPLSKTLAEVHFGANPTFSGIRTVPETAIWSYIVQIASALKSIHATGLAARVLELSKVLVTSKMRIRLNCCGILDVIQPETTRTLQEHQADDFVKLGCMMLAIACNNPNAGQNYTKSIELMSKQYSATLREQILHLCSGHYKNVDDLAKNIASHSLINFNASLHYQDTIENELTKELENGRIVRLLCKLGFINERPEYDHDPRWGDTGDRHNLKLFRDYVFHSVDENNQPVVDLAHVITCLNKLDAGVDEKLMLVSRDSSVCFVTSYKDIKRNIETAFQELTKNARR